MKKIIKSSICLVCVLALSIVGFTGCKNSDKSSDAQGTMSFENICDRSMLSGISLLNHSSESFVTADALDLMVTLTSVDEYSKDNKEISEKKEVKKEVLTEEAKKSILENLVIAQNTVSGGITKTEVEEVNKEIDGVTYKYSYKIVADDIAGVKKTYEFYYNTTDSLDDDEEDDEIELQGIVILDGENYSVKGSKETEEDESELSFEIRFDDNHYVEIAQEVSQEGKEFSYSSYENGELVFETEVEYEISENGEIEMEFETTNNGKTLEYSYEFVKVSEQSYVKVEFENGEEESEAIIKVIIDKDGKIRYEFMDENFDIDDIKSENSDTTENKDNKQNDVDKSE